MQPHLGRLHEADREEYRAVSGLAVTALVLGVLSVAALVDLLAWLFPVAGILTSGLAIAQIARQRPELVGRKAAVAGLLLSLLFGSMAVGHWVSYRWLVQREARAVGMAWFERLARGQPQLAHQLTLAPDDRQPPRSDAWAAYRTSRTLHEALEQYVAEPLLRTLLALGQQAAVRFYATEDLDGPAGDEVVAQLYAVTFEKDGQKTSFFVRMVVRRAAAEIPDRAAWQIVGVEGGVYPAWEEDPALSF